MSATTSLESLRDALAGEHSQLESWVRESFTAMDTLHSELAEWQRDLTRQQAVLDQREAALKEGGEARESEAIAGLQQQLSQSRDESRQWEEENAEQLEALKELDRQLAVVKVELRSANKLNASLAAERDRAGEEHDQFTGELRELRRLLERQGSLLERLSGSTDEDAGSAEDADDPADASGRAAELLRRANSRRSQRRT